MNKRFMNIYVRQKHVVKVKIPILPVLVVTVKC